MSKTLRTIAVIAGAVALVATGVGAVAGAAAAGASTAAGAASAAAIAATASTIATVASLTAGVATLGAQITAPKPVARGSTTRVVIDAEPPRPYMIGESYSAGILRHRVGYGPTLKKVPNPYLWEVKVFSGVGPVEALVEEQFDFSAVGGYYSGFYSSVSQLGQRPESGALTPPFGAAPGWSSAHKLSGCAAIGGNYKFDKDGKVFASGAPLHGAIWRGEKVYDPRLDSTYPGGSGSCRLGEENTYVYSASPALHAGTYAYGRYQNGIRVFGLGLSREAIDWAAIVDWANDCDTVEWTIHGTIYEGGRGADVQQQRRQNLDDICAAGGGRWLQAGALLSFDWHRPRVPLATLTDDDILEEGGSATGVQTIRERMNGVRPQYISPAHNWEQITADEIVGSTYRTEDGQPLTQTWPLNLVKSPEQAGELAAYALVDSREIGPIELKCKAQWRFYKPGETITVNSSLLGYEGPAVIVARDLDPQTFAVKLVLKSETPAKHDFALGKVANPPPTPILTQTQEDRDLAKYGAITPRQRDVEYDDGQTGEDLQPAEPGATEGAVVPTPGSGVPGNIKDENGNIRPPGQFLNSQIEQTASGRLQYRPLPDADPIILGEIKLPDLGAASQVALRQAEDDIDQVGRALATVLDEASRTRETLRDAGFYVDPANGQIRIHAIEQTRERVSLAEININAAQANINLKASVNYVDEQIALAVIDPSQIADLTAIFARLTTAEADIDGLNAEVSLLATAAELSTVEARITTAETAIDALEGEITTKVSTTTFNLLETRVTNAETTLTAIGDVATISNAVSAARLLEKAADANAEQDLRSLLRGDAAKREYVAAIASARNELGARITEEGAALASFAQALQVRVGDTEASIVSESLARASADAALAIEITELTATLNTEVENLEAAVETEQQARVAADGLIAAGLAQQVTAGRVLEGEASALVEQLLGTLLINDKNRREVEGALAGARQEITAQVVSLSEAFATSVLALVARAAENEASIIQESIARVSADQSLASTITSLNASFTGALSAETTARTNAVTALEGDIGNAIGRIDDEEIARAAGDAANADALDAAVTTLTASITAEAIARADEDGALAGQITTLSTTVDENTATLVTFGESIDGLKARWGAKVDVDGRVGGFVLNGTADEVDATFVVDTFSVVDPDTGVEFLTADEDGLRLQNGKVVMDNGARMLVQGTGFGVDNKFILWAGPSKAINLCDEASSIFWIDVDGAAFFGGRLSIDLYKNSIAGTSTANNAQAQVGPFITEGKAKQIEIGYTYRRLVQITDAFAYTGTPQAILRVERRIGTGDWTNVGEFTFNGTASGENGAGPSEPAPASIQIIGASSFTDSTPGTADRTYRASIISRAVDGLTSTVSLEDSLTQTITIVVTEDRRTAPL